MVELISKFEVKKKHQNPNSTLTNTNKSAVASTTLTSFPGPFVGGRGKFPRDLVALGEAEGLRDEDGVRRPMRGRVLLLEFIARGFLFPSSLLGSAWTTTHTSHIVLCNST